MTKEVIILTQQNLKTGFKPKKTILDAIYELKNLYEKKVLKDKAKFHSIKWLQKKLKKKVNI